MKKLMGLMFLCTASLFFASDSGQAASIAITPNMPNSGGVTLDDNGQIIEVTDNALLDNPQKAARANVYMARGHWVYFSDVWPYTAWDNKRSTSNFNHYDFYHSSSTKVGSKSHSASNVANKYSYSNVTGSKNYTAQAFYNY